jgi:hypothetical protein
VYWDGDFEYISRKELFQILCGTEFCSFPDDMKRVAFYRSQQVDHNERKENNLTPKSIIYFV